MSVKPYTIFQNPGPQNYCSEKLAFIACSVNQPIGTVGPSSYQAICPIIGSTVLMASGGTAYQWYKNSEPIDGATSANYLVQAAKFSYNNIPRFGPYAVEYRVNIITANGCSAPTSNTVLVDASGKYMNCSNPTFAGRIFLQGAYNVAMGTMNNTLNTAGLLQANASAQPFNVPPFNYAGNESVGAGFFASHPDMVDWVLLELRDASTPSTIVSRKAVFVRQNGTLVDINGSSTDIGFPGIRLTNYYVAVRHRNHLGIRTSAPVNFNNGLALYDFTTSSDKAYQNQTYTSTVQAGNVWAIRGGDANGNANIKYNGPGNDQNQILNIKLGGSLSNILNNPYSPEDVNMNGNIKWNGPGNDQNFLLNIILGGLLSTVIMEQL